MRTPGFGCQGAKKMSQNGIDRFSRFGECDEQVKKMLSKNMGRQYHMKESAFMIIAVAACAATLFLCGSASAALNPIGPFTGTLSETWESFPHYSPDAYYLADPTTIMGGGATISSPSMVIYEPGAVAPFGLGQNGLATVSDGAKGMGLNGGFETAAISFLNPVSDFGAYWGDGFGDVTLEFSDGSSASFSYSRPPPGDGVLEWHGWNSTIGITDVSYTGFYVAIDGLQANLVPETLPRCADALLLLPFGLSAIRSLRRNRKA
jgi:hypothetical protein